MSTFQYGIITVSDRCFRKESTDLSGPCIKKLLNDSFDAKKIMQTVVPDEQFKIEEMMKYYSDILELNCIITTGGTGCAPRDVTPEATKNIIQKEFPQLTFLMLNEGLKKTKFAALSRAVCGIRNKSLIINFPGSQKAVIECFDAIKDLIPHALELLSDEKLKTEETHKEIQAAKIPKISSQNNEPKLSNQITPATSETKINPALSSSIQINIDEFLENSSTTMEEIYLDDNDEEDQLLNSSVDSSKIDYEIMSSISDTSSPSKKVQKVIQPPKISNSPKKTDQDEITDSLKQFIKKSSETKTNLLNQEDDMKSLSSSVKGSSIQTSDILNIIQKPVHLEENSSSSDEESIIEIPKQDSDVKKLKHVCPHKTAIPGSEDDRNSAFPMINLDEAMLKVFKNVEKISNETEFQSPMNCPPFRASIKDGYAVKSSSLSKLRKVIGYMSAGDPIIKDDFGIDECYKINTGAAIPDFADAVIQIEDTKLTKKSSNNVEEEIEISTIPKKNQDIRDIGSDLCKGELLFTANGFLDVPQYTLLASVGLSAIEKKPRIGIISTGDELVDPSQGELEEGQIYDSNTTMLKLLCQKYRFDVKLTKIAKDDYESLKSIVQLMMTKCDVIISSGGVSMGDKDFVKKCLVDLGFDIHFGRVNMKPGKPMTFASNSEGISYFALPGNPVSAYVTFLKIVLPALRFMSGFIPAKCVLPKIRVILLDDAYELDERPEFVRANIAYKDNGRFYARINANQISSRIGSLVDADVLLHMPSASSTKTGCIGKGTKLDATVISDFFISYFIR